MCQDNRRKPSQNVHVEWPASRRPYERVHADHFFFQDKICLVVIDSFSKYIDCEIVRSTCVFETISAFRAIFARNGLCQILVTDNARNFTAHEMAEFLKSNGIQHIRPPPYSSPSNGLAEVAVRVVKNLLRKCENSSLPFKCKLSKILLYYRITPQNTTKSPPCVLLNNRRYLTVKDKINPLYSPVENKNNISSLRQLDVGSHVLALNPGVGPKWRRGVIVGQLGVNVYNVFVKEIGLIWKRHMSQLSSIPDVFDDKNTDSSFEPEITSVHPEVIDENVFYDAMESAPGVSTENTEVNTGDTVVNEPAVSRRSGRTIRPPCRYGYN